MIIKVQIPIAGNKDKALVYSKDRKYQTFLAIDKVLLDLMLGEVKMYFHAKVIKDKLHIDNYARNQGW